MKNLSFPRSSVVIWMLVLLTTAGCPLDNTVVPKSHFDSTDGVRYWVGYLCADDFALEMTYDNRDATALTVAFHRSDALATAQIDPGIMTLIPAESGRKYTDGKYLWWLQDEQAMLVDASEPNNRLLVNCVEIVE